MGGGGGGESQAVIQGIDADLWYPVDLYWNRNLLIIKSKVYNWNCGEQCDILKV